MTQAFIIKYGGMKDNKQHIKKTDKEKHVV
jgi:hypothetical protein